MRPFWCICDSGRVATRRGLRPRPHTPLRVPPKCPPFRQTPSGLRTRGRGLPLRPRRLQRLPFGLKDAGIAPDYTPGYLQLLASSACVSLGPAARRGRARWPRPAHFSVHPIRAMGGVPGVYPGRFPPKRQGPLARWALRSCIAWETSGGPLLRRRPGPWGASQYSSRADGLP